MGMFSIFHSKLYYVVLTLPEQVHHTQISMMTLPDVFMIIIFSLFKLSDPCCWPLCNVLSALEMIAVT